MIFNARTPTLRRAIVFTAMLGLLVPPLLLSGHFWLEQYTEGIKTQTRELLQQNAEILSSGMQEPLRNINRESGNALLEAMMLRNEDIVHIEVRDNALNVFISGEYLERRTGFTAVTEKPVVYRGNTIGSVKIEIGSTRLRSVLIKGLLESIAVMLAQTVLSIALILILLDRRLVRPLQRLEMGAEHLASRKLDIPFTWQRLDEIGMLIRRMEDTRISLRKLFEELDRKNQELEQDIDKRKRVEQDLHEREERFRVLVERSPIAIIEWDRHYKVIEWNAAAEHIFGYTREQAINKHASFIIPDANREAVNSVFRPLASGKSDNRHICQNRRADGQIITCQWSHTRIADESGCADRLLSIAEDITDQRLLEEQKAEADRALLRLAQGARDIAGESFFELLVADLASALRTDCAFIGLRKPNAQSTILTIAAHIRGHTIDNFEYVSTGTPCAHTLDGDISIFPSGVRTAFPQDRTLLENGWESYAGAPLRDIAGNTIGVLAVMHSEAMNSPDLVKSLLQVFSERASAELERKRAEEELNANLEQRVIERTEELQQTNEELACALETLNKAQEELVRSEKLAALGSLVAGIAHELNTPIGNSLMVASTLVDQTRALSASYNSNGLKRSMLENYIGDANKAGDILVRNLQRAANLVTGFKQVAVDQTSSQRRRFSVAEVVSEIMLTLWPRLKKTSFIVWQNIPDTLVMDSYPGPLGQVLTNLVNNALLHGFEGRQSGVVSIAAKAYDDGWMELAVKDDGVGIPPANLNRIFDPFFTTMLGAGGSGLGLNIAHNIVTGILGGRIRVQSEPGVGSVFILSLPLVAPQKQSAEESMRTQSSII